MPDITPQAPTTPWFDELHRDTPLDSAAAREAFFDRHADSVLQVIRTKLDPDLRSAFDSADFLQRTRLKLLMGNFEELHFPTPSAFMAYIMQIAAREVLQEKRRRPNRMKASGAIHALSQEEEQQIADRAPQAIDELATEEKWQNVLAKLPLVYRVVAIRKRAGYSHSEIAAELKICERTVGSAVQALKNLLLAKEKED